MHTTAHHSESLIFESIVRALRESAFWLFGAVALLLFTALFTYHPADPGFSFTGEAGTVNNAIGPVGAWLADLLFMLFGKPSYLFPCMIAIAGWFIFRARGGAGLTGPLVAVRTFGFIATLAASAALATLHFDDPSMPSSVGGVLGELFGLGLASGLSFLGATLFLIALWLAGISLFLDISWFTVMDATGRTVLRLSEKVMHWSSEFRSRRASEKVRVARQESVREKAREVGQRPAPHIEPVFTAPPPSERVERERQVPLFEQTGKNELPPLALLSDPPETVGSYSAESLEGMSRLVELKLMDFGVEVEVVSVHPGPIVTRFELKLAAGVKVAKVSSLAKDLARALSVISVRVVEIIPGKPFIGLEIPNQTRELVTLGEILRSDAYDKMVSPLSVALGKDIGGHAVVADLARMPHLLIAGTTGSGKSVAINAMVLSLLYKTSAEHVRLIMIDPKMLELSVYEGIPHLLAPVVTDMKEAANALRWCVAEMERRYQLMSALGVRHIAGYNRKVRDAADAGKPILDPLFKPDDTLSGEAPELTPLPFVVVIIDELADMMMLVGKKVEQLIARLAQKARASGIHLILATQRPSVDVITGLIKANIPARIAFQVSSRVDSRTILDQMGADQLLGHGDMLYLPPGTSLPNRVHGAFVSDEEVHSVVRHLKGDEAPVYIDEILSGPAGPIAGLGEQGSSNGGDDAEADPLYDDAVRIVTETRKASISGVQRRLKIGYNRAARMVEQMEFAGLVGPLQSNGVREVLAPPPPKD